MAEDSDKTEDPTDHKLQEARKKGEVFKSMEIVQTLLLAATAGTLMAAGSWMFKEIKNFTVYFYSQVPTSNLVMDQFQYNGVFSLWTYLKLLLPLLAVAFLVAIVANIAQIKWLFSTKPLTPSWQKISPIEGFKRIFSWRSLMELFKQLLKVLAIGYVCYKVVKGDIGSFRMGILWELPQSLDLLRTLIVRIVTYVIVAMGVVAVIDYIFQKWQYMKRMRMSIQELKDEYKETEGNPQVKAKIRQMMRQISTGQMMNEVPDSTAVVTNPTHLAVALKYKQGEDKSPKVVAKGENLVAVQIKILAQDHEVPIIENVALAKVLFKSCEVGQTIPAELYKAVAEVLAYIFKLKRKREQLRRRRFRMTARRQQKAG